MRTLTNEELMNAVRMDDFGAFTSAAWSEVIHRLIDGRAVLASPDGDGSTGARTVTAEREASFEYVP